jgi:hypothetical protein
MGALRKAATRRLRSLVRVASTTWLNSMPWKGMVVRSGCRPRPWGTVSLGKAALRPAATMLGADLAGDGIRVASITIAGQIRPGTPFSPDQIAEKYWSVVQSDGTWQSEFRFDGT